MPVKEDVTIHFRMQDSQNRDIDASVIDPTRPMGQAIAQGERKKSQALAPAWTRIGSAFIPCVSNVFDVRRPPNLHNRLVCVPSGGPRGIPPGRIARELLGLLEPHAGSYRCAVLTKASAATRYLAYAAMMVDDSCFWS